MKKAATQERTTGLEQQGRRALFLWLPIWPGIGRVVCFARGRHHSLLRRATASG